MWYCQLQQNSKGNSGDMKHQGSYLPVAGMFLSWCVLPKSGTAQPGAVLPVSSMMPHIPVGAGSKTLSQSGYHSDSAFSTSEAYLHFLQMSKEIASFISLAAPLPHILSRFLKG